jgi:antitoxin (DNA-binding transcriptional repressor) of toxin-antitoxin stability system
MTCHDYDLVMKTVGIADLKARLSEHLKSVRKGRTLTVLDRETPVAQIVPFTAEPIEVRRATRRLKDLRRPAPPSRPTDSLSVLLDDRGRR